MNAHHHHAKRAQKQLDITLNHVTEQGWFNGYASLFGISDLANDVVEKGAFAASLKAFRKKPVRMLFQHDPDQPIGHWTKLVEDEKGLFVQGQLTLDVAKAKEVHALMKSGALDGLSIGFKTIQSRKNAQTGARHILKADLWEISIVTFPLLPSARVDQVKSASAYDAHFDRQLASQIRQAAARL